MSTEMWSWAHIYRAILVPSSQPMPSLTVPGFRPGTENSREVTRVFSDRWDFHGNYRVDDGMHWNYRVVLRKSSSCQRRIYGNCRVLPESRLTRFSPLTQSTPRALLPSRLNIIFGPKFYMIENIANFFHRKSTTLLQIGSLVLQKSSFSVYPWTEFLLCSFSCAGPHGVFGGCIWACVGKLNDLRNLICPIFISQFFGISLSFDFFTFRLFIFLLALLLSSLANVWHCHFLAVLRKPSSTLGLKISISDQFQSGTPPRAVF